MLGAYLILGKERGIRRGLSPFVGLYWLKACLSGVMDVSQEDLLCPVTVGHKHRSFLGTLLKKARMGYFQLNSVVGVRFDGGLMALSPAIGLCDKKMPLYPHHR